MKRTVFAILTLLAVHLAAPAQVATAQHDDTWWARVAEQNVINMKSPKAYVQEQALRNTIYFATFYRGRLDLTDSEASIRALCKNGAQGEVRHLALAALQALGTPSALDYLDRNASSSELVVANELIAEVIAEHHRARISSL